MLQRCWDPVNSEDTIENEKLTETLSQFLKTISGKPTQTITCIRNLRNNYTIATQTYKCSGIFKCWFQIDTLSIVITWPHLSTKLFNI
ncbi:hypothetical protein BpHYR1_034916 [Brachionus plicatilis]|uniref:Uncharacterized protein n=1 Tax=Brachionus plicatilis TaxID=10195 RepID=A0A3M7RXM2_BRAPC|nr:hypothetical protein BpHYR1_034916 [Brachionus plicatilis]